jgi:hypothetical protein
MKIFQNMAMILVTCVGLVPLLAHADGKIVMSRQIHPAYQQECAACHLAYPPALLPAQSWQRVMGQLKQHYGVDASLDAETAQQLSQWLQQNAATQSRHTQPPPNERIAQSAWFVRKHQEIDVVVWRLPSVKSASQCTACHRGAEQGVFDDDHLHYPAGLSVEQRRAWND